MTITIREAGGSDVDHLVALCEVVQALHIQGVPDYFKRLDPPAVEQWFRATLARPDVKAWIATSNDVAAGYAVAVVTTRPETPFTVTRSFYQLDQIGVSPDFRRRGVARALIERVLDDARARGLHDVELTAWSFNEAARAAFTSLGFRPMIVRFGRSCD